MVISFSGFQVLKVETPKVELLREEKKPPKKSKFVKPKPEKKSIPNPLERQTKELTDLQEEFAIADIGELFGKEGFDKKKIIENAYHDIYNMIKKNKIIYLDVFSDSKFERMGKRKHH